jgi:two-component system, OmpR family, sensor kinase
VGGALAVALAIGVTGFSLLLGQRLSSSATSLARAQAEAEVSALVVRNARLVAPEAPDAGRLSGQVWVFADGRVVEQPRADAALDLAARSLAAGPERSLDGEETRLHAVPVVRAGHRYGTVVAGVSLDPYEETERTAFFAAVFFAAVLLAGVLLLTRSILGRALLPVSRMTEDAAAWSEHDIDRRFELGKPYDELTRLGATLDGLLDRLAASLRHEQRLTAELSHELRTPLARIGAEAELALNRPRSADEYRASIEAIRRSAEQMTRTVDALIAAARQEAQLERTTSDAREAVETAVQAARPGADARGLEVRVTLPPAPLVVAVEGDLLERIVQPLLENAVRYGAGIVSVDLSRNGASAILTVRDDGRGVTAEEQESIFEPGVRGVAAQGTQGAGLGLALARRLARSAGGDVAAHSSAGGAVFAIRIPVA